ncbi:MAG TPA: FecR domain-containing protein [Spirochaetota bacterium]|nr:FecR domain-containing protein [Spirochaetota bacterium]
MRNLFVSLFICVSLITFSCKKESTTTTTLEGKKVSNAKVIMVEGNAFVLDQTTNQWEQLVAGDLLKESDTIKTESKSNVEIQFQEGSIIKIKENSELKIAKLYSEQNINNTKLFLNSGTLLAKPEKQTEGSSFEVDTKSITAGVRGTEFIVVAGSNVTKVAVNSGKVIIKKRLILDSLDRVKEIDLNIAKKIEDVAIGEIELAQNEKIVVSDDDIKNLNSKVEQDISSIVSELEKNKDSEEKLKETIATIEKEKINDINSFSSKVIKKDKITDKDKKTDIPVEEFKDMGKNNISENTTTTTTIIEEKKISKDKEKVTEETTTNIEKQLVTVVDKLGNLGLTFSEKNTGVTTNNKFIYIATDTNKSLLCLNTSGKLLWKFSNPKLKKIESFITPYKNMVVFGSYDSIFVLNANSGEIIQSLDITNGTSFWAKPVEIANSIIIPTSRYTYKFDGSSISVMNEIEVSQGQVYMAAKNNSLYISDSLYQNIKEFDISSNSVTWTSNNLLSSSYMLPVISDQYLVIADNDGNLYRFNIKQKTKSYNILKIGSGVTSNIVSDGLNLYFVAKDGFFYKADLNTFNSVQKVIKVDNNPGSDKYLTKKLVMANDKIYFASDSGKIFSYDKTKNEAIFINIEENKENLPLVGSPVVINNEVYVIDTKSNIYKAYETYK